MRHLQFLGVDLDSAKIKKINVDLAGDVPRMISFTPERLLDLHQSFKKRRRLAFVVKLENCVQKFLRARLATDGFRFVNWRGKNWRRDASKIDNCFPRRAQNH